MSTEKREATTETSTTPARYKVLRKRKLQPGGKKFDETSVVAEGMVWEEAKAISDGLERAEAAAKPTQTSWTRDVYYCEREKEMSKDERLKITDEIRAHITMLPGLHEYEGLELPVIYEREVARLNTQAAAIAAFASRKVKETKIKEARQFEQNAERLRQLAHAITLLQAGKDVEAAIRETVTHWQQTVTTAVDRGAVIPEPPIDTSADIIRLEVDHHRMFIGGASSWASWSEQPAGDIHRSGSSMAIAKGRINTPFKMSGHLFVSVAGVALRVVPADEYTGTTYSYEEKAAVHEQSFRLYNNTPPEMKLEFCEGLRVNYKERAYVLTRPCLVFTSHRFGFTDERDRDLYVQLTAREKQEAQSQQRRATTTPHKDADGRGPALRELARKTFGEPYYVQHNRSGETEREEYGVPVDDRHVAVFFYYPKYETWSTSFRIPGAGEDFNPSLRFHQNLTLRRIPNKSPHKQKTRDFLSKLDSTASWIPPSRFTSNEKEQPASAYVHGTQSREEAEQLGNMVFPAYTVFVDDERLTPGGDIHNSISGVPGYIREGKIKRPFRFGGPHFFVAIGEHFDERQQQMIIFAMRAIAPDEYDGQPAATRTEQLSAEGHAIPEADGLDGKILTYGSKEYILTLPILRIQKKSSRKAVEGEPPASAKEKGLKEILSLITNATSSDELRTITKEHTLNDLSRFRKDSQERIVRALLIRHLELRAQAEDARVPTPLESPITVPASRLEYSANTTGDILAGVDVAFTTERFTTERFFVHEGRGFVGVATRWQESPSYVCTEVHAHEVVALNKYAGIVYLPEEWTRFEAKDKGNPECGCLFLLCGAPCVLTGTPYVFKSETARDPNTVETPVDDETDLTDAVYTSRTKTPPFYEIAQATNNSAEIAD